MSRSPSSAPAVEEHRRLTRTFFARDVLEVAPECLGLELVAHTHQGCVRGRIVEVEAYRGPDDAAAHSFGGRRTARTEAMFGRAGHAYVFLIYGIHHHLNVVTGSPGQPQAVLIRALEPLDGLPLMATRRARKGTSSPPPKHQLCSGPGKLCAALGIDRRFNHADLLDYDAVDGERIWLTAGTTPERVAVSPRVGVQYAGEWANMPWRYYDANSNYVSRPPRSRH